MMERYGQIVSFYSFKGGVGRSMALANVARFSARRVSPYSSSTGIWKLRGCTSFSKPHRRSSSPPSTALLACSTFFRRSGRASEFIGSAR